VCVEHSLCSRQSRWIVRRYLVGLGRLRGLASSFTLVLILAGLTSGLLTLAGAAFLEQMAIIDAAAPWEQCVGFQVGSPHAANTHLHVANVGLERLYVRLDSNDLIGLGAPGPGSTGLLEPGISSDFVFRTPGPGATIELVSSVNNLHATVAILRDDGGTPESRSAFRCLPRIGAAGPLASSA
jgi:hypothetical protein